MLHRNRLLALGAVLACVPLAACGKPTGFDNAAATDTGPATVVPIKGTEFSRVTLKPEAAERLGIKTAAVLRAHGGLSKIPYASLLYDAEGNTFAYVSTSPLVFERKHISVSRISGAVAVLKKGPAVGSKVVTVGSAELLGAEYGVEE
jgi:hypothetical protein